MPFTTAYFLLLLSCLSFTFCADAEGPYGGAVNAAAASTLAAENAYDTQYGADVHPDNKVCYLGSNGKLSCNEPADPTTTITKFASGTAAPSSTSSVSQSIAECQANSSVSTSSGSQKANTMATSTVSHRGTSTASQTSISSVDCGGSSAAATSTSYQSGYLNLKYQQNSKSSDTVSASQRSSSRSSTNPAPAAAIAARGFVGVSYRALYNAVVGSSAQVKRSPALAADGESAEQRSSGAAAMATRDFDEDGGGCDPGSDGTVTCRTSKLEATTDSQRSNVNSSITTAIATSRPSSPGIRSLKKYSTIYVDSSNGTFWTPTRQGLAAAAGIAVIDGGAAVVIEAGEAAKAAELREIGMAEQAGVDGERVAERPQDGDQRWDHITQLQEYHSVIMKTLSDLQSKPSASPSPTAVRSITAAPSTVQTQSLFYSESASLVSAATGTEHQNYSMPLTTDPPMLTRYQNWTLPEVPINVNAISNAAAMVLSQLQLLSPQWVEPTMTPNTSLHVANDTFHKVSAATSEAAPVPALLNLTEPNDEQFNAWNALYNAARTAGGQPLPTNIDPSTCFTDSSGMNCCRNPLQQNKDYICNQSPYNREPPPAAPGNSPTVATSIPQVTTTGDARLAWLAFEAAVKSIGEAIPLGTDPNHCTNRSDGTSCCFVAGAPVCKKAVPQATATGYAGLAWLAFLAAANSAGKSIPLGIDPNHCTGRPDGSNCCFAAGKPICNKTPGGHPGWPLGIQVGN